MIHFLPLIIKFNKLLKPIFSFLGKHWKIFTIVLICVGIFLHVKVLNNKIDTLQNTINQLSIQYERCQNNSLTLKESLNNQNDAITQLEVDLAKKEKQVSKYIDAQKRLKREHLKQLQDMLQEQHPETCEEATRFLHNGKEQLKWSK